VGHELPCPAINSHQEKANVRSDRGAMEIYHNGPVKIRPDYLFPAFTTIEHF
jgi:hypothetical protein